MIFRTFKNEGRVKQTPKSLKKHIGTLKNGQQLLISKDNNKFMQIMQNWEQFNSKSQITPSVVSTSHESKSFSVSDKEKMSYCYGIKINSKDVDFQRLPPIASILCLNKTPTFTSLLEQEVRSGELSKVINEPRERVEDGPALLKPTALYPFKITNAQIVRPGLFNRIKKRIYGNIKCPTAASQLLT